MTRPAGSDDRHRRFHARVLRRGMPLILLLALLAAALGWAIGALVAPAIPAPTRVLVTQITGLCPGQRATHRRPGTQSRHRGATRHLELRRPTGRRPTRPRLGRFGRRPSPCHPTAPCSDHLTPTRPRSCGDWRGRPRRGYLAQRKAPRRFGPETARQIGGDLISARAAAVSAQDRAEKMKAGTVDIPRPTRRPGQARPHHNAPGQPRRARRSQHHRRTDHRVSTPTDRSERAQQATAHRQPRCPRALLGLARPAA